MKDRIRLVRKDVHMTQKEFAQELGITQRYIAEIEGGRRVPSNLFLLAMQYRFGVRKDWVVNGKGEKYVKEKIVPTSTERELLTALREMPEEARKVAVSLIEFLKGIIRK